MSRIAGAALAAAIACTASLANAQASSPALRLIVPFGAGGSQDALVRVVADELRRAGRAAVVVENHPGAAGTLALDLCARSRPDGQTLCVGSQGTHTFPLVSAGNEAAAANARRLVPAALIGTQPVVLAVNPGLPARSLAELLAWLRPAAYPAYATSGIGTVSHFVGLVLAREAGAAWTHVPYRSGQESALSAASGQVAAVIAQYAALAPHLASGKLVAIATTGPRRLALLPEVRTLREAGVSVPALTTYAGLFAPPDTPDQVLQLLVEDLRQLSRQPEVLQRLARLGVDVDVRGPAEFAALLAQEEALWRDLARRYDQRLN